MAFRRAGLSVEGHRDHLDRNNQHRIPPTYRPSWSPGPPRRLGTTDDVARAVLFLASPQSPWITGIVMDLAGGGVLRSVAISPTSNRAAGSVPRRTCRGPRLPHGHGDCARVSRDRLTATSYATLLDSPRRSGCSLQIRGGWSVRPVRPSRQKPGDARREPVPQPQPLDPSMGLVCAGCSRRRCRRGNGRPWPSVSERPTAMKPRAE